MFCLPIFTIYFKRIVFEKKPWHSLSGAGNNRNHFLHSEVQWGPAGYVTLEDLKIFVILDFQSNVREKLYGARKSDM